jgi:hypothetical protein
MQPASRILLLLTSIILGADTIPLPMQPKPNNLIHATSPYLLQHAYNPVEWYEWGSLALNKAKKEGKPILVSIGYSSCHWCHVMEHESFENEEIASIMNKHFVSIKVDREERPDIDQIYMEAVQAMGINGGWPLNVFITPDMKPFYGGTYFPPSNWSQLLLQVSDLYKNKKDEITSNANQLAEHIAKSDLDRFRKDPDKEGLEKQNLEKIFKALSKNFDSEWGGMDRAPKFVMPSQWTYLLRYYASSTDKKARELVSFTLEKIAQGGIYDQVGGGFARYSVDRKWFAPHFEKMLYDNAQLLSLYSDAYKATESEVFKTVVAETVSWLKNEMTNPDGGFYSALDADSEGEEGRFYVWSKSELEQLISNDQYWIMDYYNVTDSGNWENGNNILFITKSEEDFIKEHGLSPTAFESVLKDVKVTLLNERNKRIHPGLDDKVLTGWNAMMTIGLLDAYTAFDNNLFFEMAKQNLTFIEANLKEGDKLFRSFRNKRSPTEGFLEDYAFLAEAYLKMYQVSFNESWLTKANGLVIYTIEHFYDDEEDYFHYSSQSAEELIARKKEIFDNVIPSSNAVMARNLFRLGIILDNSDYKRTALNMTKSLAEVIIGEPGYMSHWATTYAEMTEDMAEVVVVGENAKSVNLQMQGKFLPFALFMGTESSSTLPLIENKTSPKGKVTIFVCYNKTCKQPVHTVEEAVKLAQAGATP